MQSYISHLNQFNDEGNENSKKKANASLRYKYVESSKEKLVWEINQNETINPCVCNLQSDISFI